MTNIKEKVIALGLIVVVGLSIFVYSLTPAQGEKILSCDGKVLSLNTKIVVNDGEYVIEGNILRLITDPLKMYDKDENEIGYTADEYDPISQDDHLIKIGNEEAIMRGEISIIGEKYTILKNGKEVAYVEYMPWDIKGSIKDTEGNEISQYASVFGMQDFQVSYNTNEVLSEEEVLMIHASYYSDKNFDSNNHFSKH